MNPNPVFHKVLPKGKKAYLEAELQTIAATYGFTPHLYDVLTVENSVVLCMERIQSPCLAEKYGDEESKIPKPLWKQIYNILVTLFEREGIEYIDITPYNFIEHEGKVYIIDFGHAFYTPKENGGKPTNWFLRKFLVNEECGWNPDFR